MIELVDMPMYKINTLSGDVGDALLQIMRMNEAFRCYCNDCKTESVFSGELSNNLRYVSNLNLLNCENGPTELSFEKRFICQLHNDHVITLSFKVIGSSIQKIGQYPSVADMQSAKYARYQKPLGKAEFAELKKANLLHSFSMNIGAFIYLRRIIENLVLAAYQDNKSECDQECGNFAGLHFDKKVKMLSKYLPPFFTNNPHIYGLISKGVHELSEEECAEYYEMLLSGVLMILEEKEAKDAKLRRQKEIERSLAAAAAKHKK